MHITIFQNFTEAMSRHIERRHGLNPDNFEYVARLADGTRITKAQYDQLHRYGITTLNNGRVIDRHTKIEVVDGIADRVEGRREAAE